MEATERRRLERAYAEGHVVHVLRSKRLLDPLFIVDLLSRSGLPPPTWLHDHFTSPYAPTGQGLVETVDRDEAALLFLRRPRTLTSPDGAYEENFVARLIERQRRSPRPILLVPESLNWNRIASGVERSVLDVIFGGREAPGEAREIWSFLLRYRFARFHVGEPVNLQSVLEREKGVTDAIIAKKVRWSILHHLAREEAIRVGPPQRPPSRTRQMVLKDPHVQRLLQEPQSATERDALHAKAELILRKMAADMRLGWIRFLDFVVEKAWSRIYDGIVVDRAGLRRVWEASRRGPVVLVPSHKSHVDYLVLSQVFFKDGLVPPFIAAGENLSFWPLGPLFRRSGAFFIRRSFKGDKLYSTICAAYIKRLLREGHSLEFFIEGGRSRTGKLLAAKTGILSMCVDPVLDGALDDVAFVPVSISYEKIIEAASYAEELEGGAKKKEDVGALLSTRRVFRARTRYGRVYIDFDEPITLRAFLAARGVSLPPKSELPREDDGLNRRGLVSELSHRIIYGISGATRVTPTGIAALVLLSRPGNRTAEAELYARAEELTRFAASNGARLSRSLFAETQREALRESLGRLAQDGLVRMLPTASDETMYELHDTGRRALDYYKNNVLHLFVPFALVMTAFSALSKGGRSVLERDLRDDVRRLSQILKLEFSFKAGDSGFESSFQSALEALDREAWIDRHAEPEPEVVAGPRGRAIGELLGGMLAPLFEAYRLTSEVLAERLGEASEKELIALLLREGQRAVVLGSVRHAEAVSKITFEHALQLHTSLGLVSRAGDGRLALGAGGKTALSSFRSELSRYLGFASVRSREVSAIRTPDETP